MVSTFNWLSQKQSVLRFCNASQHATTEQAINFLEELNTDIMYVLHTRKLEISTC